MNQLVFWLLLIVAVVIGIAIAIGIALRSAATTLTANIDESDQ